VLLSAAPVPEVASLVTGLPAEASAQAGHLSLGAELAAVSLEMPGAGAKLDSTSATTPRVQTAFGAMPLSFEPNQGQTDAEARFLSRGPGYMLFLTPSEAVLSLAAPTQARGEGLEAIGGDLFLGTLALSGVEGPLTPLSDAAPLGGEEKGEGAVLRLQLFGADEHAAITGLEPLPGVVNYFRGNDPAQWQTNVRAYAKVAYGDVYDGIDLVF